MSMSRRAWSVEISISRSTGRSPCPPNAPVQARWANAQRAGPPPPNTPIVACNRLLDGRYSRAPHQLSPLLTTASSLLTTSPLRAPDSGVVNHWHALEESAHQRLHHRREESKPASVRPRTDAASQIQPQVARSNTLTLSPTIVFKGDRRARSLNRSRPTPKSTPPHMIVDVLRPSNAPAKLRRASAASKPPPTSRAPAASAGC